MSKTPDVASARSLRRSTRFNSCRSLMVDVEVAARPSSPPNRNDHFSDEDGGDSNVPYSDTNVPLPPM